MMKLKFPVFLILFIILLNQTFAQESPANDSFDLKQKCIRFPHQDKLWGFQIAAGLQMVLPPKDLLENAIQAPLVNIHMELGLPWKFSLEGDVTSILVSNQFALGPHIGFCYRNFGFDAGWDVAFFYGQLRQAGFDNRSSGWIHYPNISFGYKIKDVALTLKGELVFVSRVSQTSGENELTRTRNFLNGFTA